MKPAGVMVPVTTPFDAVSGDIAPVSWRANLRRWMEHPLTGVVLFGSTGEGVLLDEDEKLRLLGFARDVVPPDRLMIAGTDGESTRAVIRQAKRLAEAGADALLVHVPPYFSGALSPAAIRDYYLAVADASPVPIVLYHIPKYSKAVFEPGLVAELARHPNIAGLKDSSGDMKRFAEFVDACGEHCSPLVGNGALFYTALELGAAGGIIALGLLAPAECVAIYRHYSAGESRSAGEIQERIAPVHKEIVAQYGAPGVKVALELLGYDGGPPRSPLVGLSEKQRRHVAQVMQEAGLLG